MKKLVIFMVLVAMALTLMGGFALAGGWTNITNGVGGGGNPNAVGVPTTNTLPGYGATWDVTSSGSPHGNFSSGSNRCRVCHAVHIANSDSWRLLRSKGKADECDVCHGPNGFTAARPYAKKSYMIRGEHTLSNNGVTIPDSTVAALPDFGCNNCHSVHGAGTLLTAGQKGQEATTTWDDFILKTDPSGDKVNLGLDAAANAPTSSPDGVKTGFCADCHNKNPNWSASATSDETGTRTNTTSHIQGPAANGQLDVNGNTTTVGWRTAAGNNELPDEGCRGCHSANDQGNVQNPIDATATLSAFPHQTGSDKLLADSVQNGTVDVSGTVGDGNRVIPGMDEECGTCHSASGVVGDNTTLGVGQSF